MKKSYYLAMLLGFSFIALWVNYSTEKISDSLVTNQQRMAYEDFLNSHDFNRRVTQEELSKMKKADRPDLAFEQNYLATLDPATGKPEMERLFPVLQMTKTMQQSGARTPGSVTSPWVERGPNNVGGRTRALTWDPTSVNKVWAGGVSGGLWYNNNITSSNSSWQSVNDFWDNISVTAIVFDPNNSNIIYVATGEGYARANRGAGIWKSTNGGTSFSQLSATLSFYYINDMVVRNESGTSVIYAAVSREYYRGVWHGTNEGLQRSVNGGNSWSQVLPNVSGVAIRASDLDIAANNTLWVGTNDNSYGIGGGRIYSSLNGTSFSLKYSHANKGRVSLACAPSNSNYVYALFEYNNKLDAVKKTTNSGASWSTKAEPNDVDPGIPSTDFTRGQAWYDLVIDVDPTNMNNVIVGGIDLFKSTNGATSWTQISHWYGGFSHPNIHADQHAIVYKPGSSSRVIFGNDGGVAYSSNANMTSPAINHRNKDYNVTQYYSCAINPASGSNNFIAGAQDNGTQKYSSVGVNATVEVNSGDGAYCHIDQTSGNYQTSSYVFNVIDHSDDAHLSIGNIVSDQTTGKFINPSDLDDNMNILYTYKTQTSLYRITGIQSSNPTAGTLNISSLQSAASCLKVSPYTTSSTKLYVGTGSGRLFRITTANATPTKTDITGASFPTASISCIEFGQTENDIIVTFSNYGITSVWYSSNGGTSWISKEGNLPDMPVRWALFNPLNNNEVILATEVGVWSSSDFNTASPSWTASNSGLANVRVDMLQIRSSDNEIIAATHGRGLFSCNGFAGGGNPSGYCAATSTTSPCDEYISNVTIGTINNNSTCGNYTDYTSQSTNLVAGAVVPMTITSAQVGGTGAGFVNDQVAVWIDWNNDSDFMDANESVYTVTYIASTTMPLTFNVTVPSGAVTNSVRMRVRMSHLTVDGQITPCGNSLWGEVEDYTVNIQGATPTYCAATSTSTPCDEYISSVSISNISNTTTCGNYSDYTSQIGNVQQGASVGMGITNAVVGATGSGYTNDQVAVWVDWNNDMDFTDAGEDVYLVTVSTSTTFPLTFNIAVPNGATLGHVRMRVRLSYFPDDGQITPCGNSQWGEVEDYTLNVMPATALSWTSQPGTRNIECDASSDPNATGTPTATSTCPSGVLGVIHTDNTANGSCANASVITRTWTANDGCGGVISYDQTINISDNTDPVISCPGNTDLLSTNGTTAQIPDYRSLATVSDNCSSTGNITVTQSPLPGSVKVLGVSTVTLTGTDECGNSSSCNFDVAINYNTGVENFSMVNLSIFPNPTNGDVQINLGGWKDQVSSIRVFNILGEVIYFNQDLDGKEVQLLNLDKASSGVLFIEVKTANESIIKRILKL